MNDFTMKSLFILLIILAIVLLFRPFGCLQENIVFINNLLFSLALVALLLNISINKQVDVKSIYKYSNYISILFYITNLSIISYLIDQTFDLFSGHMHITLRLPCEKLLYYLCFMLYPVYVLTIIFIIFLYSKKINDYTILKDKLFVINPLCEIKT